MKKMTIYEPAMCCCGGVSGVRVNPELMRVSAIIGALENKGIVVERFNLSSDPQEFVNNKAINDLIKKDTRVFLKVNLLSGAKPEQAVTTHPVFVYALAKILNDYGARVVIGDSPNAGIPYRDSALKQVYTKAGLIEAAQEAGAELNYDTSIIPVSCKDGSLIKQFNAIKPAIEADVLISVAKGKTHGFTYITGAVKNMFGVIPGFEKAGYHAKLQTLDRFSTMLVDIYEQVKPELSFMDAITCMEGDGPGSGDPRQVGAILASRNAHALDSVFSNIIGIDCQTIPTLRDALSRKLLNLDNIDIRGAQVAEVQVKQYKMPATLGAGDGLVVSGIIQNLVKPLFKNAFVVKPVILKKVCIGCGVCVKGCPMEAIKLVNGKAVIDYHKCIRCYCCHEFCPHHSIELRKPFLYKISDKILK
ncbi:MAG: arsenic metallochaperone ArsD family protein [bacterium]